MSVSVYYQMKTRVLRPFVLKRGVQCYIISYPKSGRTWLRLLLGKALCDQLALPEENIIDTYQLTAVPGVLRTHFTHDYADIRLGYPYYRLPTNKSPYARTKVIFLIRDMRDTLVSSYFQATKRVNRFHGPITNFVRDDRFGINKIVTFYNLWQQNQRVPSEFMLLRYEELHQDPANTLRRTLHFMNVTSVDEQVIQTAVAFASFDNMKKMESSRMFANDKMRPGTTQDADSFKVRQGRIGGYTQHLSPDDLHYIQQQIIETGCPFIEQYYI
jgi:hypothetical protein